MCVFAGLIYVMILAMVLGGFIFERNYRYNRHIATGLQQFHTIFAVKYSMRFCKYKIFRLFIAVMTIAVSFLQYHHHGCDGTIYFAVSGTEDIAIGATRNHLAECSHDGCPHGDNGSHSGGKCAMHMTSGEIIAQRQWHPDGHTAISPYVLSGYCAAVEIWESLIRIIYPERPLPHTGRNIFQNKFFRGPPTDIRQSAIICRYLGI